MCRISPISVKPKIEWIDATVHEKYISCELFILSMISLFVDFQSISGLWAFIAKVTLVTDPSNMFWFNVSPDLSLSRLLSTKVARPCCLGAIKKSIWCLSHHGFNLLMKLLKVYVGMCAVCVLKLGVHGRLEVTFQDLIGARVIFAVKGFSFHADVPLLVFMVSVSYCCISLVWIFFSVFFIDAFF